ncbi:MAG: FAD:protein FMN transferase [Verrucomicrobiales bacterium]|nr:FAD:protein FMN transferase [Verrucomicrobiales bacterium]
MRYLLCHRLWLLVLCCRVVSLPAAAAEAKRYEFSEAHMGTVWTITCYADAASAPTGAVRQAFERIDALERAMTDYDPESELLRFCAAEPGQWHSLSSDLFRILEVSGRIVHQTQGVFDPTVGPLVQVWRRARRQREFPELQRRQAATAVFGWTNVALRRRDSSGRLRIPGMRLDLGGIAKGFAADAALQVLRDRGIRSALVAASGDLAIGDAPPGQRGWRVRVGDPSGRTNTLGQVLLLRNAGVSTSGDTEQFVEIQGVRYSHIVDPRTGLGLTNRMQATVIAENATRSDALATAVCILGAKEGQRMIDRDRKLSSLVLIKTEQGYHRLPSRRFPQQL